MSNPYTEGRALIVSGPRDGEWIEHKGRILQIAKLTKWPMRFDLDPDSPVPVETLIFERVTFKIPDRGEQIDVFVPREWIQPGQDGRDMLVRIGEFFLRKAAGLLKEDE